MDPLSITTSVLALLGACIKAYGVVGEKLKIFRHYSREVKRIQTKHHCQVHIFRNEIHHLLRIACPDDEAMIEEMLDDDEHPQWQSTLLQQKLELALGKERERMFKDVIEDMRTSFSELQDDLRCFDSLTGRQREVCIALRPAYLSRAPLGQPEQSQQEIRNAGGKDERHHPKTARPC